MKLKEQISEIIDGYKAEVSRTKLLSAFLGRVAISEAESITGLHTELDKVISGEVVHSASPGDKRFVSVHKQLLINVATPLKTEQRFNEPSRAMFAHNLCSFDHVIRSGSERYCQGRSSVQASDIEVKENDVL